MLVSVALAIFLIVKQQALKTRREHDQELSRQIDEIVGNIMELQAEVQSHRAELLNMMIEDIELRNEEVQDMIRQTQSMREDIQRLQSERNVNEPQ